MPIVYSQAHFDGAGAATHTYSHVSLGTPVARVDRTSNTIASIEFQFHGLASNTLAAVDYGGTVNASFSYTPFGEVVEAMDGGGSSGVAGHRRRFNDKQLDELSNLSYYGARYLDKISIQWTQSDPLYRFAPDAGFSAPRRANLQSFGLNNPLRYIDPDGLDPTGGGLSATTCIPSSTGSGCAMDASPAAYDGEKTWLASGGREKKNEESGQLIVTDVPSPEFAPEDSDLYHKEADKDLSLKCHDARSCTYVKATLGPLAVLSLLAVLELGVLAIGTQGVIAAGSVGAPVSRVLQRSAQQLQAKFKHAPDFGVVGNYSKANAAEFSRAIHQHINSPSVRAFEGTYHGQAVTHYLNPSTGLNVMADPAGNFISGWRLSSLQLQNVLTHGGL